MRSQPLRYFLPVLLQALSLSVFAQEESRRLPPALSVDQAWEKYGASQDAPVSLVVVIDGYPPRDLMPNWAQRLTMQILWRIDEILEKELPRTKEMKLTGRMLVLIPDTPVGRSDFAPIIKRYKELKFGGGKEAGEYDLQWDLIRSGENGSGVQNDVDLLMRFAQSKVEKPRAETKVRLELFGGSKKTFQAGLQYAAEAQFLPKGASVGLGLHTGYEPQLQRWNGSEFTAETSYDGYLAADHLADILSNERSLIGSGKVDVTLDVYNLDAAEHFYAGLKQWKDNTGGRGLPPKIQIADKLSVEEFRNHIRSRWIHGVGRQSHTLAGVLAVQRERFIELLDQATADSRPFAAEILRNLASQADPIGISEASMAVGEARLDLVRVADRIEAGEGFRVWNRIPVKGPEPSTVDPTDAETVDKLVDLEASKVSEREGELVSKKEREAEEGKTYHETMKLREASKKAAKRGSKE